MKNCLAKNGKEISLSGVTAPPVHGIGVRLAVVSLAWGGGHAARGARLEKGAAFFFSITHKPYSPMKALEYTYFFQCILELNPDDI